MIYNTFICFIYLLLNVIPCKLYSKISFTYILLKVLLYTLYLQICFMVLFNLLYNVRIYIVLPTMLKLRRLRSW